MQNQPTVSVVIPAYNSAAYLEDSIESVLGQSYPHFELIVVDDGSTDNTAEVMGSYAGRCTYVRQENAGSAEARNHGIRLAKGELIAFLDADDIWVPHKLERQIEFFKAHPDAGMVYAHHVRVEKDGRERPSRRGLEDLPSGQIFEKLFVQNIIPTSSVILTREAIEKVGMFGADLRRAQDFDLWLRVAHDFNCYAVPEALHKFRSHEGSASTDRTLVHDCVVRLSERMYERYKDSPPRVTEKMFRDKMASQHVKTARSYLRRGDPKAARAMHRIALKHRALYGPALLGYLKSFFA